MNYAVLTYLYAENPRNIPISWIAEAVPLIRTVRNGPPPEGTPLIDIINWPEFIDVAVPFPEGTGWVEMTESELISYKENNLSEYLAWLAANEEPTNLEQNFKVEEYSSTGKLIKISWFQDKVGDSYINLAKEISYSYLLDTTNIQQIDSLIYNSKSETISHEVTKFYTDTSTNKIVTETEYI